MARPNEDGPDLEGCTRNHCHARKRDGSGTACHLPAGWATDHATNDEGPGVGNCKLHGGSVRNARVAARTAKARIAAERFGGSLDIDPATALLQEVQRSAATVAYLQLRVQELEEDQIVWGVTEETIGADREVKKKATPNAWIVLYQQERRHLAQVSKAALDAGATATIVDVFRQVGTTYVTLVGRVVEQVIVGLELSDEDAARAATITQAAFQTELDNLTSGAAA
ncbi:hypothetical protein [Actinomadura litoris]|uniref:Uncharacterized protein n=1 Tax=Actinomadura litoris TaxID=2678616 RepID=A0A7K1LAG7_9ACTN|nr:hypothetical protein [Actinomadura litoris]MUN41431.1 hypothetical protein [Actinomadura litoris]